MSGAGETAAGTARPEAVTRLGPELLRVLADNPSPMTHWGTNTYLVGSRGLAVIDPGPDSDAHLAAILGALAPGQHVSHILVTHAHVDHSPLARRLSRETGARVHAFGAAGAGRSEIMRQLAGEGLAGGGEGVDEAFAPDVSLGDGDVVEGDGWRLRALWTPGHMGNHLSFHWQEAVFCGDLVMGWASSLVSPPDGDVAQFMASCERLRALAPRVLHSGHGAPIEDPAARLDWLIAHRRTREAQILEALDETPRDLRALTARLYADTDPRLWPAAQRNVFAHLVDLHARGLARAEPRLSPTAAFCRG